LRKDARIYVAGARTLVGAALLRQLRRQGYDPIAAVAGAEPDLTRPGEVHDFFRRFRPEYVFVAAGKTGGIAANQRYPAELIRDNLLVATSVIEAAHRYGVEKLLYLASSCSYPKHCPQPMRVEHLMTGPLEPTNAAYATAKLAGLQLCLAYRQQYGAPFVVGIPANPFGPGDDFHPEDGHVIGALLRRMHAAKEDGLPAVTIWGSGTPRRDFIYADDLADACLFVMDHHDRPEPINLAAGTDVSIRELAELVRDVVGYDGDLEFDRSRPDGMPVKVLDGTPLARLGWRPATPLRDALAATYQAYLETVCSQLAPRVEPHSRSECTTLIA
jgi:GDP-L-fucose synthase